MLYATLSNAIQKLNAPIIKFDWDFNALIISAVIGEYHIALATFQTNDVAKFCLSVKTDELLDKLNQINPTQDPNMDLELLVIDEIIDNAAEIKQVLKIKDLHKTYNYVQVEAQINHAETLRVFSFEDYELELLVNKETLARSSDFGYKIKSTKKSVIEITTNKKNQQTICIPERNLRLCLDHPDWNLSVVLLADDSIRLVHKSDIIIKSEMIVHADHPTVLTIQFTTAEWNQVEFAAKIAAQLKIRSPLDIYLTGVEFQTGSRLRIKGFSGDSVYSLQIEKSSEVLLRFLISYQAFYKFANLREPDDKAITLYIKDDNSFVITSESAALRGQLMDNEMYPTNWHELPVSRAVPAQFDNEFRKALIQVTEYQHWSEPNSAFVRLFWDNRVLVLQGTKGNVRLHPKNKGYDSSAPETYVSASALISITDRLDKKFRLALPNCETEMLRLSDDRTEAAIAVLYEPHYSGFKKKQVSSPDKLVEENLSSIDERFDCRAIEVSPMNSDDVPEPGAFNDNDENPEETAQTEIMDFVRTYQSYGLFAENDAPAVSTIKQIYQLAIPEEFEKRRTKTFYEATDNFANYIFSLTVVAESLTDETLMQRLLSLDELSSADIKSLRTVWQISLNREYWRGYNDALSKVKQLAKDRNLEGYEEIVAELKTQIPADLKTLCDRLRIWIGRLQLQEQNLAPTMQTEFRPK
jgi:hypothetical protein